MHPSVSKKFKILVAGLTQGSDPSRGPSGNPKVSHGGFELQIALGSDGVARLGGPRVTPPPPGAGNYTAAIQVATTDFAVPAGAVAASGDLTFGPNATDGKIVTIDGKTYTFQTVLTNVDGHVLIGGSAAISLANLVAAITLGPGSGVAYAAATTLHPTVTATSLGSVLTATAKTAGVGGNALATTTDVVGAAWTGGTLSGGADTIPPPLYLREEVALFDQYISAGDEFGAGEGNGSGSVTLVATGLAAALNQYDGIKATAVGDTVYILSLRETPTLPIKATDDMSAILGGVPFLVSGPGGVTLSSSPNYRQTFYVVKPLKTLGPPIALPPFTA